MKTPNLRLHFIPYNDQPVMLFWVAISKGDGWWEWYGQYKVHLN